MLRLISDKYIIGFSSDDYVLEVWDMEAVFNSSSNDPPSSLCQRRNDMGRGFHWIVADEYQIFMFGEKRRSGVCQL